MSPTGSAADTGTMVESTVTGRAVYLVKGDDPALVAQAAQAADRTAGGRG